MPTDHRGSEDATGAQNSTGLGQRGNSLGALHKVVQRPEHDDCIGAVIRQRQFASVRRIYRESDASIGLSARLLHMEGVSVEHRDAMTLVGEPSSVHAGATTNVDDVCGRRGQPSGEKESCALPFQDALAGREPIAFQAEAIVLIQVDVEWTVHA